MSRKKSACTQRDGRVQAASDAGRENGPAPPPARRTRQKGTQKKGADLERAAIGYVRVSTEEQAKYGVSIAAQTERIHAYCLLSGLELQTIITEEGVSGAKKLDSRPGGAELVAAISRKMAGHVIALKLDRLFRDAEDALRQTRAWDRAGVALHLIDMGGQTVNTASAMGRMMLTMMAAFAELERNLIAERTAAAVQHKKRKLQVYGPVPVGYERRGEQLEASAGEQVIVAQIRGWRADGRTLREIADLLNDVDVARKRGGKQWYASTVARILHNDIHDRAA